MSRCVADATVFTAIADPTRRAILWSLRDGARSVSELMEPLDVGQSAFSQHLAVLRRAGLVTATREGRRQIYAVNPEPLYEVACWIRHFDRFWDDRLGRLGRYLDRKARPPR
jgi:DNA-binding transcriptional ArsR family regulator